MKKPQKINNLLDLKTEIVRMSALKKEQEAYLLDQYGLLRDKVEAPMRIFRSVTGAIPGVGMVKGVMSGIGKAAQSKDADWLTRILQVGTPFLLNNMFLKKAGWLKKSLVLLASESAISQVNQNKVGSILDKVTDFIRPKKRKKKNKDLPVIDDQTTVDPNFGIPPDSETY